MDDPVIVFDDVTKYYSLKKVHSFRKTHEPGQPPPDRLDESGFAALRNVSFAVRSGEVVGLIGHNGAGKTTALRILGGLTNPSSGSVIVRKPVTALLTLLAGMRPHLTGRDNIYMHGALMGFPRSVVREHLAEIIDFADIGAFADLPMATYSTGMRARLAFAASMVMNSGIILIDEVLSVGDYEFQEKALRRMREYFRSGNSIVIASHNIPAVRSLCHKLVWLENGIVRQIGTPDEVLSNYTASYDRHIVPLAQLSSEQAEISEIEFSNALGIIRRRFPIGESIHLTFNYAVMPELRNPTITVAIYDYAATNTVYRTSSEVLYQGSQPAPHGVVNVVLEDIQLHPRQYHLVITIDEQIDRIENRTVCKQVSSFTLYDPDEPAQQLTGTGSPNGQRVRLLITPEKIDLSTPG